jgi:hypothetical protein
LPWAAQWAAWERLWRRGRGGVGMKEVRRAVVRAVVRAAEEPRPVLWAAERRTEKFWKGDGVVVVEAEREEGWE